MPNFTPDEAMLAPQARASLEAVLVSCGAPVSADLPLERFFTQCSRMPFRCCGRAVPVPLKTLLFHFGHLRPDIKAGLETWLCEQWRVFHSESSPPPAPDAESAAPAVPPPTEKVASPEDHRECRPMSEDWFDRLLNGVRFLLFL